MDTNPLSNSTRVNGAPLLLTVHYTIEVEPYQDKELITSLFVPLAPTPQNSNSCSILHSHP